MILYYLICSPVTPRPTNNPLILFDPPVIRLSLIDDKSPKSVAFPVDAIVINSIILTAPELSPPATTPLVPFDTP